MTDQELPYPHGKDEPEEFVLRSHRGVPEPLATGGVVKPNPLGGLFGGRAAPLIYAKMIEAMREATFVAKTGYNKSQDYPFRGIDGVINELGPALRKAGVFTIPEVLDYRFIDTRTTGDKPTREVRVQVRYTMCAEDGSSVGGTVWGESLDTGDKGTAKAMSVAYRIFLLQVFNLPTQEPSTDHDGHYLTREGAKPGLSKWETNSGLTLLDMSGETPPSWAESAYVLRAELFLDALDFANCLDEHDAWDLPIGEDVTTGTWRELLAKRIAFEIDSSDTLDELKEIFTVLAGHGERFDLEHQGEKPGTRVRRRKAEIVTRNATALDTITKQVLDATDPADLFNGGPVIISIREAHNQGRITLEQVQELGPLIDERLARLAREAAGAVERCPRCLLLKEPTPAEQHTEGWPCFDPFHEGYAEQVTREHEQRRAALADMEGHLAQLDNASADVSDYDEDHGGVSG